MSEDSIPADQVSVSGQRIYRLIETWRSRCDELAAKRMYWQAAQLNEAVNALDALLVESTEEQAQRRIELMQRLRP